MKNIQVKVGKLEDDEKFVLASKPSIMKDDLESLELFNKANYFLIKKGYIDEELCGYIVFFLGYHGLESNDVSIERICFPSVDSEFLNSFISKMVEQDGFPFLVENIYCNEERLSEEMQSILSGNGVLFPQRGR